MLSNLSLTQSNILIYKANVYSLTCFISAIILLTKILEFHREQGIQVKSLSNRHSQYYNLHNINLK